MPAIIGEIYERMDSDSHPLERSMAAGSVAVPLI
ncbi:hypothetical protein FOMCTCXJ_CDS_0024 [Pseudomonas phage Athelas]|nr:hypothetical protein FOMCTCXJ_CDS_0024 [Pseudomonas phage Athelas]